MFAQEICTISVWFQLSTHYRTLVSLQLKRQSSGSWQVTGTVWACVICSIKRAFSSTRAFFSLCYCSSLWCFWLHVHRRVFVCTPVHVGVLLDHPVRTSEEKSRRLAEALFPLSLETQGKIAPWRKGADENSSVGNRWLTRQCWESGRHPFQYTSNQLAVV